MAHTVWLKGIDTLSLQKGRRLRALVMYHRHGNTIKKLTIRILEIPEFPYNVMRDRLKEARVLKYQFDPFIRLACFDPVSASNR